MKRNFKNLKIRLEPKGLGKGLVLLAGVSLCGLVVLEASQQMVKAFDLKNAPVLSEPQTSAPPVPVANVPAANLPIARAATVGTAPKTQARSESTRSRSTQPGAIAQSLDFGVKPAAQPQTLALNSGSADDPQQPVSQASATQIATAGSGWTGASFPVEGFQAYTSAFGYRQSADGGYSQEFHYGLDMAAPEGSYVRNWWGGKVVEVTDNTNCGTSVVLESGNWTHIYCHMEGHVEEDSSGRFMLDREGGLQIYVGQQVPAGARIGRVGMSGRTTGPHLHWGLKFNGNWVDPAYVLQAMYAGQQSTTARAGDRTQ
jgi:murein DD-endopeptidase MepM/ murein hydrolase activator NlpD